MRELSFRGGNDLPKVTQLEAGREAWSLSPRAPHSALWPGYPIAGLTDAPLSPWAPKGWRIGVSCLSCRVADWDSGGTGWLVLGPAPTPGEDWPGTRLRCAWGVVSGE